MLVLDAGRPLGEGFLSASVDHVLGTLEDKLAPRHTLVELGECDEKRAIVEDGGAGISINVILERKVEEEGGARYLDVVSAEQDIQVLWRATLERDGDVDCGGGFHPGVASWLDRHGCVVFPTVCEAQVEVWLRGGASPIIFKFEKNGSYLSTAIPKGGAFVCNPNFSMKFATRVDLETAAEIAAREERRAKRSKLGAHLLQRLQHKHKKEAYSKATIGRAITAYLDANPSCFEVDLRKLDFIVDRISLTLEDFVEKRAATSGTSSAASSTTRGGDSVASLLCDDPSTTNNNTDSKDDIDEAKWSEINPWVKMSLAKTVEAEQAEKAACERKAAKRETMAANLNAQVAKKKLSEETKRKEDKAFVAVQQRELEEWHVQAAAQRKIEEASMRQAAETIKNQIAGQEERKRAEQELVRARERGEIEEMKRKLQLEEDRQRQLKEDEKRAWDKIKEENKLKLLERERRKEEEAALDAKLMADMKARLDREEAERAQALADRLRRNEEFVQKLKEAEQYQQGEDKRIEEERAVLREMEAREQREREKERRKKEDQKKRQESIIETNRRMAENKKQALLELEREEENYADKCRREAETLLQEEQEKQARRDRLKKLNSTLLTRQIEEQQKAGEFLDMNGVECSINKEQVGRIENNTEMKRRILEMVTSNTLDNIVGVEGSPAVVLSED